MKEKFSEIMLMGLGSFGVQTVKRMPQSNFSKFYINIKNEMIEQFHFDESIILDSEGFGYDSNLAYQVVLDHKDEIKSKLTNVKFLFLLSGLGGATGSGAVCALAEIAKELGIIVVAVITTPSDIEAKIKHENSKAALDFITEKVDSIVTISFEDISKMYQEFRFVDLNKYVNNKLQDIVDVITDIVILPNCVIPINPSLMKSVLTSGKFLYISQALATGDSSKHGRSKRVVKDLFEKKTSASEWEDCNEMLILISASEEIAQFEINEIITSIKSKFHDDKNINYSFGLLRQNELANDIKVGLIASKKHYSQEKKVDYSLDTSTKIEEFDFKDIDDFDFDID